MDCDFPVMRIEADEEAADSCVVQKCIPSNETTKFYQHAGTVEPDQPVIKIARTTYTKHELKTFVKGEKNFITYRTMKLQATPRRNDRIDTFPYTSIGCIRPFFTAVYMTK